MSDMRFGWSKKGIPQRGGEKEAVAGGETGWRRGKIVFASFFVGASQAAAPEKKTFSCLCLGCVAGPGGV
jgi:hypothetical protein